MFSKPFAKVLLISVLLLATTLSPSGIQVAEAQSNCQDNYEPNNTWDKATQLSPGQYQSYICTKGDYDMFQFNVNAGSNVVSLSNLPADYDVYIYSATQGKWIGQSENGGKNEERFRWNSEKGETIYVVVAAYDSNITSSVPYVLTVGRFPDFWLPVNGLGEGINTPIGSLYHTGPDTYALDFASSDSRYTYEGMSIYPALAGRVVYSGFISGKGYGCVMVIRTWDDKKWDRKIYTLYAHLQTDSRNNCLDTPAVGTILDGSKPVGHMGKSGEQSVVHLHFAVRYSDQVYDGIYALWGKNDKNQIITPAFDPRGLFK